VRLWGNWVILFQLANRFAIALPKFCRSAPSRCVAMDAITTMVVVANQSRGDYSQAQILPLILAIFAFIAALPKRRRRRTDGYTLSSFEIGE
jgi:hypothetical protein